MKAGLLLTGIGVATGVASAVQSRRAAKDQKRANARSKRIQDIKAARERRQMLARARVQQAGILAQGSASGTLGSSGVQSGASQVDTGTASGISFLNQVQDLTNQASLFQQRSATHRSNAGLYDSIGNVAGKAKSLYG